MIFEKLFDYELRHLLDIPERFLSGVTPTCSSPILEIRNVGTPYVFVGFDDHREKIRFHFVTPDLPPPVIIASPVTGSVTPNFMTSSQ